MGASKKRGDAMRLQAGQERGRLVPKPRVQSSLAA